MKIGLTPWVMIAVLLGAGALARAAPPTVVPSPGYDARLQEQRAVAGRAPTVAMPANPPVVARRHLRKKHAN